MHFPKIKRRSFFTRRSVTDTWPSQVSRKIAFSLLRRLPTQEEISDNWINAVCKSSLSGSRLVLCLFRHLLKPGSKRSRSFVDIRQYFPSTNLLADAAYGHRALHSSEPGEAVQDNV